jgi:hypothetical protein
MLGDSGYMPQRLLHTRREHDPLVARLRRRYVPIHGGSSLSILRINPPRSQQKRTGRRDRRLRSSTSYGTTSSEASTHLIYTNVDIALMPSLYSTVAYLIDRGHDAFVINRRKISDRYKSPRELPLMYAEVGKEHPGHDCFVFPREAYPKYRLGRACLGVPGVGRTLLLNLAAYATSFREFQKLHATFHIGNDQTWRSDRYADFLEFNFAQVKTVLLSLELDVVAEGNTAFSKLALKTHQLLDSYLRPWLP